MANKKKNRKRTFLSQNTIFKFVRLAALAAPGVDVAIRENTSNEWKIRTGLSWYTGYVCGTATTGGGFDFSKLQRGWTAYLASILVTRGIGKISGILRSL